MELLTHDVPDWRRIWQSNWKFVLFEERLNELQESIGAHQLWVALSAPSYKT